MRKIILLAITVFTVITSAKAQDFSNKGKEFWLAYSYHVGMVNTGSGTPAMTLFLTSDVTTTYSVEIYGVTVLQSGTINANQVVSVVIPNSYFIDNDGLFNNRTIRVTAVEPIVVYSFITRSQASAATLCLPTNVLGKEYYAASFTQNSNEANSNSYITIVAVEDNTEIEITVTADTKGGWAANSTNTINLNKGQVYQVLGTTTGNNGVDLSGSHIKSIASGGGGCKKIAVFSGSGKLFIGAPAVAPAPACPGSSSDNLYQQLYPVATWGKNFLTVPSVGKPYNHYRVMRSDPATKLFVNGVAISAASFVNDYYQFFNGTPNYITADYPIAVAQYFTSQGCPNGTAPGGGNPSPYDPDMVLLSPVEQSISNVTLVNTPLTVGGTQQHNIHIVMKTGGTAQSSFKVDGVAVPIGSWVVHPANPAFSYLYRANVAVGNHTLVSDSGFNAIAYGYGNAETYAYSAGANVRDLTQALELESQYGNESSPSACTNSPFKFKVYFPDSTLATPGVAIRFDSLKWDFHNAATIVPNNFPIVQINPTIDSTNIRSGRQVNWYSIPGFYFVNAPGNDTLFFTTYRSTSEGCGTTQVYEFPIPVYNPPVADFTWTPGGCAAEPYQFTETTPQLPKPTYKWWWDFGDPTTGGLNNSLARNPTHTFSAPGTYTIRYAAITTPGCLSDTISHTLTVAPLPDATLSGNTTVCINSAPAPDVTFTAVAGTGTPPYTFTYTINGGGPLTVSTIGASLTATVSVPTNIAGPFIYNLTSVKNTGSALCTQAITGQSITVNITPDATVTLTSAAGTNNQTVCINNPIVNITYDIGGSGTNATITGLPAGVTGTYASGVVTITGTPTAPGTFNYTVTTVGPCLTPNATGTITVTDDATIALTSAAGSDNQTLCINTPLLINITYLVGGSGTGGTVTGLPAGVNGVYAGGVVTISGAPTAAGTFNYTVNTTGPCIKPTATGTITVTGDGTLTLTSAAGTNNQSLCINIPITNITYSVGGTGTGGSVIGLPPGVTGVFAGGVITISGTPTSTAGSPYMYTVTTTGPCVIPTATGTITVNPDASIVLTSAAATTSQELCRNSTITNITYAISGGGTGATFAGLPAGVTGVYAGGIVTISGTPTVAGTFNYTVTTTGTCAQNSLGGTIIVDQLPTAAFTYTLPSCETRDISFTDGSTPNSGALNGWTWDFGDGSPLDNTQNPTHIYPSVTGSPFTVTLIVTTDKGCTSNPIASQLVTINNRPEAGFIVPDVCINDVATPFTDTSKIAAGAINRPMNQWNYGDPGSGPLNNSVGVNGLHLYTATGIYQVTQIVTSSLGCKDTIVLPITINSADPNADFNITSSATLCSSDSVALVNLSTVGFGNVTKLEIYWDNVGAPLAVQTISPPVFNGVYKHKYPTLTTTQNYVIRMVAYSGVICLSQKIVPITVYATPSVQFNAMPNSCLLVAPFLITQGSETGGVPGTGTYSGPGITNPNGTFDPQIAGVGTHAIKYTFTASNPGACIDTLTKFITVLDTAHAIFSFVSPSCEQVPTSFTDNSTAPTGVVLANTVWNFGDGTPVEMHAPGSTFGHVFAGPGTFTVTMHNLSAYGCLSTDTSASVTIDANQHITLTSANNIQTLCVNTPIAPITYTLSGGATNVTIPALPAGLAYAVAGTPPVLTISGAPTSAAGSPYNFTVQTTGNTCLIATANISITVEPDHIISRNSGDSAQSVCVNTAIDPIVYDLGGGATSASASGLPPGVTGVPTAGNTFTIRGTPTSTAGSPYNFTIQTSGNGCVKANTIGEIKVNPYPVPAFTFDNTSYCIPNANVGFINNTTPTPLTDYTYTWDFGDGGTSSAISPSHLYTSEGPFNVTLKARSTVLLNGGVIGCESSKNNLLNIIHPQPKADFVFSKPSVCIGDQVIITDNTDGKDGIVNQWHWEMGDGVTKVINPVPYTYGDTTTYIITMYSVNSFGCNSDTINKLPITTNPYKPFTVYPYPKVNAGPDKFVLEGGSVELESVVFARNPQYAWTPALYLTDSHIVRPRVMNPKTDMTYLLTVTGSGGCQASNDVFVKLLRFPEIPNTFTPNGDGINDTWKIDYLNTYPDNRVQIFTRSGKLVFESRGYTNPWDGTIKGKPLPFDTYYYIIEPGNGRDPITGYVTIIK